MNKNTQDTPFGVPICSAFPLPSEMWVAWSGGITPNVEMDWIMFRDGSKIKGSYRNTLKGNFAHRGRSDLHVIGFLPNSLLFSKSEKYDADKRGNLW